MGVSGDLVLGIGGVVYQGITYWRLGMGDQEIRYMWIKYVGMSNAGIRYWGIFHVWYKLQVVYSTV